MQQLFRAVIRAASSGRLGAKRVYLFARSPVETRNNPLCYLSALGVESASSAEVEPKF